MWSSNKGKYPSNKLFASSFTPASNLFDTTLICTPFSLYCEQDFDKCFSVFMEHYNIHKNDNTAPYEGILDLMKVLKEKGVQMSVVSMIILY